MDLKVEIQAIRERTTSKMQSLHDFWRREAFRQERAVRTSRNEKVVVAD